MRLPILQLSCRPPSAPLQARFSSLQLLAFPKDKIVVKREEICERDGRTVYKFRQRANYWANI